MPKATGWVGPVTIRVARVVGAVGVDLPYPVFVRLDKAAPRQRHRDRLVNQTDPTKRDKFVRCVGGKDRLTADPKPKIANRAGRQQKRRRQKCERIFHVIALLRALVLPMLLQDEGKVTSAMQPCR